MYIYYIHSGNDIEQMLPYQKFNGGTGTRIVYLFFRVVCCEPLIKKKKKNTRYVDRVSAECSPHYGLMALQNIL